MIFVFQISAVLLAVVGFRFLPITYAGMLAGSGFVLVALYSIFWSYKQRKLLSIGFYLWLLFLIFFAVPIFALRLYHFDLLSSEISIGSIQFSQIHKFSEKVYFLAFLGTIADFWRAKRRKAT